MTYSKKELRHLRRRIGATIHDARCRDRISIRRLAEATQLSFRKIDAYELGRGEMKLEHLFRISIVLGIGLADLLEGPKEKPPLLLF